jgi:hypothetical protein
MPLSWSENKNPKKNLFEDTFSPINVLPNDAFGTLGDFRRSSWYGMTAVEKHDVMFKI